MREEIIKLLDQYRLKEALSQMTGYATHTSDWQLKNELEALQTSYDLMLQYTSKGMKDPNKWKYTIKCYARHTNWPTVSI